MLTQLEYNTTSPVRHRNSRVKPNTDVEYVRSLGAVDTLNLCDLNRVHFDREAPNAGILTMRARNAMYKALREGIAMKRL